MSRREKQRKSLTLLERDFISTLNAAAMQASNDQHSRFFLAERYNPWPELRGRTDSATDELIRDADRILQLRADLGETPDCPASTFLSFCEHYCDDSDANRNGVQKHAVELLNVLYEHAQDKIAQIEKRAGDSK